MTLTGSLVGTPSLEGLAHAVGSDRTPPRGLSLEKLRKHLPVWWDEQRKCWREVELALAKT